MSFDYTKLDAALSRVKKQLRPYQIECVEQGISTKRILIDMYMGLGKTVCALTIMLYMKPKKVLILCSRNSMGVWQKDMEKWFPEFADGKEFEVIKASGQTAQKRKKQWNTKATVVISTIQTFIRDRAEALKNGFNVYIIDEAHKVPQHKTKTFKELEKALRDIPVKILQTGTWLKRHAGRGWRHLHLLSRKLFPSYWKFINRYCEIYDGPFGKEIIGPKNTKEFYIKIKPLVYRYHKLDGNVPKSVRKPVWIEMDSQQEKIYRELSEDMLTMLDNGKMLISNVSLSTFTKHRQLLNCPQILEPSLGLGSAVEGILQHFEETDDPEEQHAVIFSFFKKTLPILREKLKLLGYDVWEFSGGMDPHDVTRFSEQFRASKGKKSIALCTMDFAESFHLGTAIRSHFIGAHFDTDPMKQAEARLARADSDLTKPVVHRYWFYLRTLDETRRNVLNDRHNHVQQLFEHFDNPKDIKELLNGSNSISTSSR